MINLTHLQGFLLGTEELANGLHQLGRAIPFHKDRFVKFGMEEMLHTPHLSNILNLNIPRIFFFDFLISTIVCLHPCLQSMEGTACPQDVYLWKYLVTTQGSSVFISGGGAFTCISIRPFEPCRRLDRRRP